MILTTRPEMTLGEFLQLFDLSPARTNEPEKPLAEQHVGYVEFLRTDYDSAAQARVRVSYRHDENLDVEITVA